MGVAQVQITSMKIYEFSPPVHHFDGSVIQVITQIKYSDVILDILFIRRLRLKTTIYKSMVRPVWDWDSDMELY